MSELDVEDEPAEVGPDEVGLVGVPGVVVAGGAFWLIGPLVSVVKVTVVVELLEELVPDESPPLLGGVVVTGMRGALVGVVEVWVDVVCDGDWLDDVPPDEVPPLVVVCTGDDTCVIGPDETGPETTVCCCGL